MKSFLLKILLFLIVYFGFLFVVYQLPYKNNNFFHSVEDKHKRLEKDVPQIIIVGGSNTLFGVDSKMIVDSLNHDVVNMGLHMFLGYYYQTQEIVNKLNYKDIVVLIPEYANVYGELVPPDRLVNQLIEHYPQAILTFDKDNRLLIFYKHFLDKMRKNITHLEAGTKFDLIGGGGSYSFTGVNKYGDQTDHLKIEEAAQLGQWNMKIYLKMGLHDIFIEQTDAVVKKCKEVDCEVYISFPSLARSAYNDKVANAYIEELETLGYKKLGIPKDYVFDNTEMYDTYYHLLAPARKIRTERLISALREEVPIFNSSYQ